jgi:hypothetical protein
MEKEAEATLKHINRFPEAVATCHITVNAEVQSLPNQEALT